MLTTDQISAHEVRVVQVFKSNPGKWLTNDDIANGAEVAQRTARLHTRQLTLCGLLEQARAHGAFRYRLAAQPTAEAQEYLRRWQQVSEAIKT